METTRSWDDPPPNVPGHGNRRRDVRLPCNSTTVHAYVIGRERPVYARVVEVSKSGLQLHVNERMPVGAVIRIDMGDIIVQGEVRHCDPRPDDSWTVGVLVLDVTERT